MQKQTISHPLTNSEFLKVVSNSFNEFVQSGTSRSTKKLKPLHGEIAKNIALKLGCDFEIESQGYGKGKEAKILGRYFDKQVDIAIKKDGNVIAAVGVKFIMQNYSQNSNNYFENMLGETANIRTAKHPYFQIFIILDKLPYYEKDKSIKNWESFTSHNADKYQKLSTDNPDIFFHTPNKTLIYVVHIPDNNDIFDQKSYMDFYKSIDFSIEPSKQHYDKFSNSVIFNNYEIFIDKLYHTILAI